MAESGFGELGIDPGVAAALGKALTTDTEIHDGQGEGGKGKGKGRRRSPHEVNRATRSLRVTFASAGWVAALEELADRWGEGVEKGDVVVYAVSLLLDGEGKGVQGRPPVRRRRAWMRTGEVWEWLPWRPGDEEE